MSDTRRRNAKPTNASESRADFWLSFWLRNASNKKQKAFIQKAKREKKLEEKGADGHNVKDNDWRFESAKKDGSGKLNTFDETGAKRRANRKLKRHASKDTRRIGKAIARKESEDI